MSACVAQEAPSGSQLSISPAGTSKAVEPTAAAPSAKPTAEFGSLAVSVTTVEVEPIAGAQVTIEPGGATALTDSAGAATFNDLSPGRYTVLVAKPGYRSQHERGKLVDVIAGEVTEIKMVLEAELVIDADTSYHKTLHFRGLISCSFNITTVGYSPCTRGLIPPVQPLQDANDNSTHPWDVDAIQVSGIILEAKWQPSAALLGSEMQIRTGRSVSCGTTGCNVAGNVHSDAVGKSPLRGAIVDKPDAKVSTRLSEDATKYPFRVYSEARAHCTPQCRSQNGGHVLIQQRYDMYASSFYGNPPPDGWSALPK